MAKAAIVVARPAAPARQNSPALILPHLCGRIRVGPQFASQVFIVNLNELGHTILFFLTIALSTAVIGFVLMRLGWPPQLTSTLAVGLGFGLACGIFWVFGQRIRRRK